MRNPVDRLAARLPTAWRVAVDWIVTVGVAIGLVLALKAWVINPYRIPSSSMEPTLHCSSEPGREGGASPTACSRTGSSTASRTRSAATSSCSSRRRASRSSAPAAGAACSSSGSIALPGETWRMEDGVVYIDGKRLVEPYLQPERRGHDIVQPQKVPPGHYIMLGDNRQSSCDSRAWGTVPRENLIGKVIATYWPPQRISLH